MNDDFLHRIRVEPPAGFMANLKARLDRQLPPAAAAPRRSLFRVLAFGLLFGGAVFAISLLTVNGLPDFARNLVQTRHHDSKPDAAGHSDTAARLSGSSDSTSARTSQHATEGSNDAGGKLNRPRSTGAPGVANSSGTTTQSIAGGGSARLRPVMNLVTPKVLQEYMRSVADDFGRRVYNPRLSVTTTETTTEALAQFCSSAGTGESEPAPDFASVPRRITRAEFEVCTRNVGNIAEVPLGYQAIVLARSKLYGTLAMSASDIFLALAAEIPDPAHPETLITNPNTTWDNVNAALGREPIEVFGPPAQSMTGIAFREILFAAGCNSFPTISALKKTDGARYERVCSTFRKDAAYVEMPEEPFDSFQTLQSHPNSIAVLAYGMFQSFVGFPQNNETLTTIPIGGVEPTRDTISAGTYPGSRALYLYVNQGRAFASASFWIAPLVETARGFGRRYSVIPPGASQAPLAIGKSSGKLPDLKM
jgi:phosphate transport system substrate-binding protein